MADNVGIYFPVTINSRNATPNTNNQDFTMELGDLGVSRSLKNYQVALQWVNLCNSVYIVNQYRNKIYFQENGGATLTATLDEGNYDEITFPAEIETQMNSASGLSSPYTVTFSTVTNKININISGGDTVELVAGNNDAYRAMGFSTQGIGLGTATDYLSDGIMDLSGSKALHIEIPQLGNHNSTQSKESAWWTIPLTASFGFVENYRVDFPSWLKIGSEHINHLEIRLWDDEGNPFEVQSNTYLHMGIVLHSGAVRALGQ
jgi:hypothetical protein